ncbi:MAG: hypothetical protein NT076_01010 [Candidatus Pacearchaeota archaeon]|nr:hypothetical protein [Candidatus Pacearchaeota archaeon]
MKTRTPKRYDEAKDFQRVYRQVKDTGVVARLQRIQSHASYQTAGDAEPGCLTNELAEAERLCREHGGEDVAREYLDLIKQYYGGRGFVANDLAAARSY